MIINPIVRISVLTMNKNENEKYQSVGTVRLTQMYMTPTFLAESRHITTNWRGSKSFMDPHMPSCSNDVAHM
jgi:hypothetical protein